MLKSGLRIGSVLLRAGSGIVAALRGAAAHFAGADLHFGDAGHDATPSVRSPMHVAGFDVLLAYAAFVDDFDHAFAEDAVDAGQSVPDQLARTIRFPQVNRMTFSN